MISKAARSGLHICLTLLLLISAILPTVIPSAVLAESPDGIIVEDADWVGITPLEPSPPMPDAVPRVIVEYGSSVRHGVLEDTTALPDIPARIIVEYGGSIRRSSLERTTDLPDIPARIIVEYGGSIVRNDLQGTTAMPDTYPRIIVTSASSIVHASLTPMTDEPSPPVPFEYPLYHPWTDTLGFGQSWGSYYGHLGADYAAPKGTPAYAVASGEVVLRHNDPYPGEMKGWGNALIIRHELPGGETIYSQYAHFQTMLVNQGETVEAGQQIGTIGQTGFATGPHLHLEIKDTAALGPGYAGYSFTGDSWTHGGVTYYRPSTFIEQYRGLKVGDELAVTGTGGVGLRLRSGPLLSPDNILTVMPEGSQVTITAGPTIAHGYGWWQVQFGGLQGWAAGRYLASTEGQVAPDLPTSLAQYTVDGTPVPPEGDIENTRIVLKGAVTSPAGGLVKLQVEVRREGQTFTRHTHEGPLVASGQQASVTVGDLAVGAYHWRARAVTGGGMTSDWVYFSAEPADFVVLPVLAARFSFYPGHPMPGEEVEFDASASYPSWRIVSYQWDFDDGRTATGKVVHHEFSETGTFDVRLSVEFDDGRTDSVAYEVSVVSKQLLDAVNSFVDDAIRDLDRIVDIAVELAAAADYYIPSDRDMDKHAVRLWINVLWGVPVTHLLKLPKEVGLLIPSITESATVAADRIIDRRQEEDYDSILVDPFRDIVEGYRTELLLLRDEVLDEAGGVPPEQVGSLLFDLRWRSYGNDHIRYYTGTSSHFPRAMKAMREYNERDWAYQRKRNIFNICVGTATVAVGFAIPGGIIGAAIYGGVVGFGHIMAEQQTFLAKLDQDGELGASACGSVTTALIQAATIFENTKDGLENILSTTEGMTTATVPLGRMASIEHMKKHAVEKSFGFFEVNWFVREAYSEVIIENRGSEETDYWLYVAVDRRVPSDKWFYVIPMRYFDTSFVLEDEVENLPAGSPSDPVRFTYLSRKEGGFIPEGEDGLFFVLVARASEHAVYSQDTRVSTFGTTLITADGQIIPQEELEGASTYEYPIRSQLEIGSEPGDYMLTIFVSNPTGTPLMAGLVQPFPAQGEVVYADGGVVGADSIIWDLHMEAGAVEVLEVAFTGVTDSPFEMPAGQYEIYDIINDNWLSFDSDPLLIETPLTIITDELSDGKLGVAYEATLEAFGGTPPYFWDWTAQEDGQRLPPGLHLVAATGIISGTPVEAGSFNFTVEVIDDEGLTALRDLSLNIMPAAATEIMGEIREVNCAILPGVTVTLYLDDDEIASTVSDEDGYYTLPVPGPGEYTVVASKEGFRNSEQSICVDELTTYTVDFVGDHGLVPNAPNMSYVLACINLWQFGEPQCKLGMSTVLAVINAWQFPVEAQAVTFLDANLEAAIREAIDKPTGDIYPSDLEGLTYLDASRRNISDLTGLEHCTNLIDVNLWDNQISGISPLANLTRLTDLDLGYNQISDISPVANLTNLTSLRLHNNPIGDISPLATLTELTTFSLSGHEISGVSLVVDLTRLTSLGLKGVTDISDLANLTNLISLFLYSDEISDISPMASLTNLTSLAFASHQVSDILPLEGLTNLDRLYLWGNQISDVSPLEGLTNLDYLLLSSNQISDISALANLTSLQELTLVRSQISDISALANLTNLTMVQLTNNQIASISPLANLTELTVAYLSGNQITDISALASLVNLTWLTLQNNQISDISPLVQNEGLGSGDTVWLGGNPLSSDSINVYIPHLQARGVTVYY